MRPKLSGNAQYCERFLYEARAIARLKGEHVAQVHDVGTMDGVPYMVIEYVEGLDLATKLKSTGTLAIDEAVLYVLHATDALAEAHKQGVVHRDIKPANLFLTKSNDGSPCVKVIDFGIAKTAAAITQIGVVLGSPRYMPPEQIREAREVDARADIWALGIVLYEMLTGETPFQGNELLEVCESIVNDPAQPPSKLRPDVPPELDAIVLRCLAKDRDARFPNVGALALALKPFAPEDARHLAARVARILGMEASTSTQAVPREERTALESPQAKATITDVSGPPVHEASRATTTSTGSVNVPIPLGAPIAHDGSVTETALTSRSLPPPDVRSRLMVSASPADTTASRDGRHGKRVAAIATVALTVTILVLGGLVWLASIASRADATSVARVLPASDVLAPVVALGNRPTMGLLASEPTATSVPSAGTGAASAETAAPRDTAAPKPQSPPPVRPTQAPNKPPPVPPQDNHRTLHI